MPPVFLLLGLSLQVGCYLFSFCSGGGSHGDLEACLLLTASTSIYSNRPKGVFSAVTDQCATVDCLHGACGEGWCQMESSASASICFGKVTSGPILREVPRQEWQGASMASLEADLKLPAGVSCQFTRMLAA